MRSFRNGRETSVSYVPPVASLNVKKGVNNLSKKRVSRLKRPRFCRFHAIDGTPCTRDNRHNSLLKEGSLYVLFTESGHSTDLSFPLDWTRFVWRDIRGILIRDNCVDEEEGEIKNNSFFLFPSRRFTFSIS